MDISKLLSTITHWITAIGHVRYIEQNRTYRYYDLCNTRIPTYTM